MTSDCELINTRQISLNLLQPGLFPIKRELCEICKNFKIMWMAQILIILPVGIENLEKLALIA